MPFDCAASWRLGTSGFSRAKFGNPLRFLEDLAQGAVTQGLV
jgi:hypothetical protein